MQDLIDRFILELKGDLVVKQSGLLSFLVMHYLVDGWLNETVKKLFRTRMGPGVFITNGSDSCIYFAQKPWVNISIENLGHLFEKKQTKNLDEIIAFNKVLKSSRAFYKKFHKQSFYRNASDDELASVIRKSVLLVNDALASAAFVEALDDDILLDAFLKNGVSKQRALELIELSKKPSFESISLTTDRLLLRNKKPEEIHWLFTSYYSSLSFGELKGQIDEMIAKKGGRKNLSLEVKRITKEIKLNKKNLESSKKIMNEKEKIIVDFAILNMWLRDARIEPIKKMITVNLSSVFEYSRRIGLDKQDALMLFSKEIFDKKNTLSDLIRIAKLRREGMVLLFNQKGKFVSFTDYNKALKRLDDLMQTETDFSVIKGFVANRGFAKGTVKIVLNEKDFSKFSEGDILVASMTRVEYVPLMKKAGAIVTDEGGITCHAAIVSRELNKPCVIGTKVSTRMLKDGDLVEVDANRGIVKKLG